MRMAWMTAHVEWRRRWGSLALLALLVTLAGGVTIGAVAAARRADTAFARFTAANGDPEIQADGFAGPGAWEHGHDGAPEAFTAALALPGVVGGQRFAAVAVATTEEFDPFSFAIIDGGGSDRPSRSWSTAGCSTSTTRTKVSSTRRVQRPSASVSATRWRCVRSVGIGATSTSTTAASVSSSPGRASR